MLLLPPVCQNQPGGPSAPRNAGPRVHPVRVPDRNPNQRPRRTIPAFTQGIRIPAYASKTNNGATPVPNSSIPLIFKIFWNYLC